MRRLVRHLAGGVATAAACGLFALSAGDRFPADIRLAYALVSGAAFTAYFVCADRIQAAERPELAESEDEPPTD